MWYLTISVIIISYRLIRIAITQADNITDPLLKYHPPEVCDGGVEWVLSNNILLRTSVAVDVGRVDVLRVGSIFLQNQLHT